MNKVGFKKLRFDSKTFDYKEFIEEYFQIVNKDGETVDFKLNDIQKQYLTEEYADQVAILKARQQGFSSLITAIFTVDFIWRLNCYNMIIADKEDNAEGLLKKVKFYIESFERKSGKKINLKYNSKNELYNGLMRSTFVIGTAHNTNIARSRTITNLLLSEVAFYRHLKKILASAGQATVEHGRNIMETTANGFNEFKAFWNKLKESRAETSYKPLFYKASDFYTQSFLKKKKITLGDLFPQEYPETDIEAFVTSGECYFDKESLGWYLSQIEKNFPMKREFIYG